MLDSQLHRLLWSPHLNISTSVLGDGHLPYIKIYSLLLSYKKTIILRMTHLSPVHNASENTAQDGSKVLSPLGICVFAKTDNTIQPSSSTSLCRTHCNNYHTHTIASVGDGLGRYRQQKTHSTPTDVYKLLFFSQPQLPCTHTAPDGIDKFTLLPSPQ